MNTLNKRIFQLVSTLILVMFNSSQIFADHFVGGIFSYQCINDQEIHLDLSILIEENTYGSSSDPDAYISVYFKPTGGSTYEPYLEFTVESNDQEDFLYSPSPTFPIQRKLFILSNYPLTFDQFNEAGEYLFVYQRCCRTRDLTNLSESLQTGSTISIKISYENGSIICNDTPQFSDDPIIVTEAGETFNINLPITETDGDSLVYSFSSIYLGGGRGFSGCNALMPITFCPPPYDTPLYQSGYSYDTPFGVNNQVTLDPITGVLSGIIETASRYAIGIQIEEYRNGELLGIFDFEQQLIISDPDFCTYDLLLNSQEDVDLLGAEGCSTIKGNLTIIGETVLDLSPLSNIDSIYGNLVMEDLTNATSGLGLSSLRFIGGNFSIVNTTLNNSVSLSNLNHIGESLKVESNNQITSLSFLPNITNLRNLTIGNCPLSNLQGLEQVDTIRGSFSLFDLDLTETTPIFNLKYIGLNLSIKNLQLNSLDFLDSLAYVYEISLRNIAGLEELNSFNNLEVMDSYLTIENNNDLNTISGFQQLKEVFGITLDSLPNLSTIVSFPDLITSRVITFTELPNLTEITAFDSLETTGSIFLENLDELEILNSFHNLTTVTNLIRISFNSELETITGFENLNSITSQLEISFNSKLINIDGFQNLIFIGDKIEIRWNPSLPACAVFCPLLYYGFAPQEIDMSFNELFSSCRWPNLCEFSRITARTYLDENENGEKDEEEIYLKSSANAINVSPGPINTFLEDEIYKFHLNIGTYDIVTSQSSIWNISSPVATIEIIDLFENETYHEVGLTPNGITSDASIALALNGTTRCDSQRDISITVNNNGNSDLSGQVLFIKNPNVDIDFFFFCCPPDTILGDSIFWSIEDLPPTYNKELKLRTFLPSVNFIGEALVLKSQFFDQDQNLLDEFEFEDILTCSYDPNDKLTNPDRPGEENFTLFEEDLIYTIRFENIGNGEAINVRVLDIISTELDINTFQIIKTSDPITDMSINYETREINFFFNNINLGPGTTLDGTPLDNPDNKGFIQFRIKPLSDLTENTVVRNQAEIYFDGNEPIITNTALNTFVSELPTVGTSFLSEENALDILLFPNPSTGETNIATTMEYLNTDIEIFNTQGQLQRKLSVALSPTSQLLDLDLNAGVYFIKILDKASNEQSVLKFVRIN